MAPLIVITGPTASGKTGLAIELASNYNGEIICADSRTIYKGVDIGSAKPTQEEQSEVPHHMLDIVEVNESYNAQQFQQKAFKLIDEIRARNHVPFLVGGTGLYIDAVTLNYEWPAQNSSDAKKATLEQLTAVELQNEIVQQGLTLPENSKNKRHLINVLLRGNEIGRQANEPDNSTIVVAIATEKDDLDRRIRERAVQMFDSGIVEEAQTLAATYGWDHEAMTGNIYPIIRQLLDGQLSQEQAIDLFVIKDRQLAKRQLTWLKRHYYIKWGSLNDARTYIEQILSSYYASIEQV